MSAPSGIKVPSSLTSAFSNAQSNAEDVRALVFIIEGESFNHHTTVNTKGNYKDDIALLSDTLPTPKTPASFAYRLDSRDGGKYEWMMITFVPDDAGVRSKMLQASSRSGLLKALGANNFKHDWFATSPKDLTPSALNAHLNHMSSPPPLTASEAALAEVKEAEAAEAKRAALDPENEARRKKAVVGLSGKMAWGDGVEEALKKCAQRSDDGWVVCLEIPASNPGGLSLLTSEACAPSALASKLPSKSPCYTFYSYPTPPPPAPVMPVSKPTPVRDRNTFQASEGGVRSVATSWAPKSAEPEAVAPSQTEEKKDDEEEKKEEGESEEKATSDGPKPEREEGQGEEPDVKDLTIDEPKSESPIAETAPSPPPVKDIKGRVLFIYSCPSSSPVKFRMVYSTSVRGVQQDAADKAGVEVVGKASQFAHTHANADAQIETSDINDLTESHLKSSLPMGKPTHSSSLPTPSSGGFGAPRTSSTSSKWGGGGAASAFAGPAAFGAPRPITRPAVSASQVPLPASGPATPAVSSPTEGNDEGDNKDNIRKAFDAFGPRVNSGGGGGGFARPRPAGRR